jgi:hypothetical protein
MSTQLQLNGQLILFETGVNYTIDFEETIIGVNEGAFSGLGLQSDPIEGQLDSEAWLINGCSQGNTSYGLSYLSGDYTRGSSLGDVTLGGVYAFNTGANTALGWQSTASDLSPGEIILKVQNASGFSIERLKLSYTIWNFNNEDRSQTMNAFYSLDNISYFPIPTTHFTSPTTASSAMELAWEDSTFAATLSLSGLNNNDFIYIKWRVEDEAGSGSRDEWALDDISLEISNNTCISEIWALDTNYSLQSIENFSLIGVDSFYDSPSNFASHSPAARMDDDLDRIQSQPVLDAYSIKFWMKGQGNTSGSSLLLEGFDGSTWQTIANYTILPSSGSNYQLSNLNAYSQFRFTYSKSNGNLAIDDITISCGACELASEAPQASGDISFSDVYCNQSIVSWLDVGAAYYLVLASTKQSINSAPLDQSSYKASNYYGLGELFEDSVFVVYNGSESTFTLQQLESNSNYLLKVYPYNGLGCEENYAETSISANLTIEDCAQCPYLLAAMINPCTENCVGNEGFNEFLLINSGEFSFEADSADFKIFTRTQEWGHLSENLVSNPALVDEMNGLADCPTLFIDAQTVSSIPSNSIVLFCNEQLCLGDIDVSLFCLYPVIYVIASDSPDWNPNGEFVNTGHTRQEIQLDLSAIYPACVLNYSYNPNDLPAEDGLLLEFSSIGGGSTNYSLLAECGNSINPLPLLWGDLTLSLMDEEVQVQWSTLSEWNNSGFSIERSFDGTEFEEIAWENSLGDAIDGHDYSIIDRDIRNGIHFYRIKQIDHDGLESYSNIESITVRKNVEIHQDLETILLSGLEESEEVLLFSMSGMLLRKENSEGLKSLHLAKTDLARGIYIISIRAKESVETRKIYLE